MPLNNLYFQVSGTTGWKDSDNDAVSYLNSRFGVGTNLPLQVLHVAGSGSKARIELQETSNLLTGAPYQAILSLSDKNSQQAGYFGFGDITSNDLTISNKSTSGSPNVNVTLDAGVGIVGSFTKSGKFGVQSPNPSHTLEVIENESSQTYLAKISSAISDIAGYPELLIRGESVGVGVSKALGPAYHLHVGEDFWAHTISWSQSGMEDPGATYIIDYSDNNFITIDLTGDSTFSTTNGASTSKNQYFKYDEGEVRATTVKLYASGGDRELGFNSDIRWLGVAPTGLPSGKIGVVSFNSFGPNISDTVAVYREEDVDMIGPAGPAGAPGTGIGAEGFGNRIIGGDFLVNPWQRGELFTSVADESYTADRFVYLKTGSAVHNIKRVSDTNLEINWGCVNKALEISGTTAQTSFADQDNIALEQRIEGYNWRYLSENTLTLSFWAKSSETGKASVYLQNEDRSASYISNYEMINADTWEEKRLTIFPSVTGHVKHPVFPLSNLTVDTSKYYFQDGSASLDGIQDIIEIPFDSDFQFGKTDACTIECFAKFDLFSQTGTIFSNTDPDGGGKNYLFWNSVTNKFNVSVSGTIGEFTPPYTMSTLDWHHIALVKSASSTFKLYVSGQACTETVTIANDFYNPNGALRIGTTGFYGAMFEGNIDEFRVSDSERYTSNFSIPTSEFSRDANTKLLLHFDSTGLFKDYAYDPSPVAWNCDSGVGLRVGWSLGAGTGLKIRGDKDAYRLNEIENHWVSGEYYTNYSGGQGGGDFANFCDTTSSYLKLNLVHLHRMGNDEFIDRPYHTELDLCRRYYEVRDYVSGESVGHGQCVSQNDVTGIFMPFETTKRTYPIMSSGGDFTVSDATYLEVGIQNMTFPKTNLYQVELGVVSDAGYQLFNSLSVGNVSVLRSSGESKIIADAEL